MFNERAANWAERMVMKLPDEAVEPFVTMVTLDVLTQDIKNNQRTLDAFTAQVHQAVAKRLVGTLTRVEGTDAEYVALAALVSKSRPGDEWNRDKRGRFASVESRGGPRWISTASVLNSGPHVSEFEQEWNRQAAGSTNQHTYDRIQAGSKLLGSMPSKKAKAAGQFGQFVGQHGPEAEKVVGPSIRRAAYRYRGTERKIDPQLIKEINTRSKRIIDASDGQPLSVSDRMNTARATSVLYLQTHLPKRGLSRLQLSAGQVPPSQGIMINAEGKVITQAIGYSDDHYLPFNLKNLRGLQGGEYVRSRAYGGPTTEDIYTGLVGGARSVTVVSHSGTFTVNFDDAFRGKRRFNDKALAMVDRYAKLLDAINSEQVERNPLSWEDRATIRSEVEDEMKGFNSVEIEAEVKRRENEFRQTPQLSSKDLEEIDDMAREASDKGTKRPGGQLTTQSYKVIRAQLISEKLEEKANNKYRLDGEGYKSALDALQEQFPYYIESVQTYTRANEGMGAKQFSNAADTGYVAPRYIKPTAARAGYFDPTIAGEGMDSGTGKTSAKYVNYANWKHNPVNSKPRSAEEKTEEQTEEKKEPKHRGAANVLAAAQAAGAKQEAAKKALRTALTSAHERVHSVDQVALQPYVDEGDFDAAWFDPMKRQAMVDALSKVMANYEADKLPEVRSNLESYRSLTLSSNSTDFNQASYVHGSSPAAPHNFPEPAYEPAATQEARNREWQKLQHGWVETISPGEYTDAQLRTMTSAMGNIASWANKAQAGNYPDTNTLVLLTGQMNAAKLPASVQETVVTALTEGGARLEGVSRLSHSATMSLERMRRLQANEESGPKTESRTTVFDSSKGSLAPASLEQEIRSLLSTADVSDRSTVTRLADAFSDTGRLRPHELTSDAREHYSNLIDSMDPDSAARVRTALKKRGYDL